MTRCLDKIYQFDNKYIYQTDKIEQNRYMVFFFQVWVSVKLISNAEINPVIEVPLKK
jgi:hypothetical protein